MAATLTRGRSAIRSSAVGEPLVAPQFIPNDEFEAGSEDGFLQLPAGVDLYADEDDAASASAFPIATFGLTQTLPILSREGEAFLFRKMNYLKFCAAQLCSETNELDESSQRRVEHLLADANAVRNHIAECNLRLVISIARKFATEQVEFDDFLSEGNMILLKAIDKFDFSRGFRFSTYATHSVQRHFYRYSKQRLRRRKREMASSATEISQLSVAEDEVEDFESIALEEQRLQTLLHRMDECLDEREQFIVRERFGIGTGGVARTLRDIGAEIGVSKERVRQIQWNACDKLREFLGEMGLEPQSA